MKASDLKGKTLDCEIVLSTGDRLTVTAKRYGITVADQSRNVSAANKFQRGEMTEGEFIESTCQGILSLVQSWDLMEDDNQMYPLEMSKLAELPAVLLDEIVRKIMESLTFQRAGKP